MIDSKALTEAIEKMTEATEWTRLGYRFCPSSYTFRAMQACLAAAKALDEHIDELAFMHSAEWLRKFPRICPGDQDYD
jgi:hypothetical protein